MHIFVVKIPNKYNYVKKNLKISEKTALEE